MRAALRALASVALVACGSCTSLTEIIVVVDSDLEVPAELDSIRIRIVGPAGEERGATANLTGNRQLPLPRSLGVVHDGGALGPVTITVSGMRDTVEIVQRRARVYFVPGEVRVLRMDLLRSCVGVRCTIDETCAENGCRSRDVGEGELEPWTGVVSGLDASVPAPEDGGRDGGPADACVPAEELCNELDDDCDGHVDETFDLQTDRSNCGACGLACPTDAGNASSRCAAGECALDCYPGWADCDLEMSTGCEALLSAPSTCGSCGTVCREWAPLCADLGTGSMLCVESCDEYALTQCGGSCVDLGKNAAHCGTCDRACPARPHAVPACDDGACSFRCDEGWHDCNGSADDGCESQLRDLENCGACGEVCALPRASETCTSGTCVVVACDAGFGDCDAAAPGCETDLSTDRAHCGACGMACAADPPNASNVCSAGGCTRVCDSGWADCNGVASDGCESDLSSPSTCGGCGISCEDPSRPVCASNGADGFACTAGCGAGAQLCGGSCVDTMTDPRHCGACGNACTERPASSPICAGGACALSCDPGFGDCNGVIGDGCETPLTSATHCGTCGTRCALDHASESCATGTCVLTGCDAGWADCNATPSDGCETPLGTTTACRSCSERCPSSAPHASAGSTCTSSGCQLLCDAGWADCNRAAGDGCETSLTTLTDCGACGAACARDHASATCAAGTCRVASCDPGWGDCDRLDVNGCEQSLRTLSHCGACGSICALEHASETCETGACRISSCDGGWENCDTLQPNGCETSLTTLSNCGACGSICSLPYASETCGSLSCAIVSCDPGRGDCDSSTPNGCETDLTTAHAHCGACGSACLASQDCCGGSCCDGSCCGASCCPAGRTCCGTTCCAFGEVCTDGVCQRVM